ncbi:hypothetical protein Tco_0871221 [Tanacetum coccineum]
MCCISRSTPWEVFNVKSAFLYGKIEEEMGAQTQGRYDHEMEADFEFTTAEDKECNKKKRQAIMKESEPTQTKTKIQQEQERLGFEEALRLQEQFDEEERQRIASIQEEASTFKPE